MTLSAVTNPKSYGNTYPQGSTNPYYKAYGSSNTPDQQSLAAWYADTYKWWSQMESGTIPRPSEQELNEIKGWMEWAYNQLNGGGNNLGNSGWNPQGFPGMDPTEDPAADDPFGGQVGPHDNIVYAEDEVKIGFHGEEKRHDIWPGNLFQLDVSSPAATVTVEITNDELIGGSAMKFIVKDAATDTISVYYVHEYEGKDILIRTPNGEKIDDLTGLVEKGEFKEGELGEGGSGTPEPSEVTDDGTAIFRSVGQQPIVVEPPYGDHEFNEIYGNFDIKVGAGDHVVVKKGMPGETGGYTVEITTLDGEKRTFYLHKGFKANIDCNTEYITWKMGNPEPGKPQRVATEGIFDGVPEAFKDDWTVNGQGYVEEESEDPDAQNQKVQNFIDFFTDPEITFEDIPESLLEEIKYGDGIPSSAMLAFLIEHDEALKHKIQGGNINHIRGRLEEILQVALGRQLEELTEEEKTYYDENADPDLSPHGAAAMLKIGGEYARIETHGGGDITLNKLNPPSEADEEPGAQGAKEDALANAQKIADMDGVTWSAEEIVEWAENHVDEDGNSAPIDLSYVGFPPSEGMWKLLYKVNPGLKDALKSWWQSDGTENTTDLLRDKVIEIFKALYPDKEIVPREGDNLQNDIKIDDQVYQIFDDDWITNAPTGLTEEDLWEALTSPVW